MSRAPLLLEVGSEELPPRDLPRLGQALANNVKTQLEQAKLEPGAARWFASPRRLAVIVDDVLLQQNDQTIDRLGPALAAAFDDGQPTPAALGFAKSCGVELDQLEHRETDKGVRLAYRLQQLGQPAKDLVLPLVELALNKLPVAKPMRWNDHDFSFVRPIQWIVALHGKDIVAGELFGRPTGRASRGHRFHSSGSIDIAATDDYVEALRAAHVMVDPEERKALIKQKTKALAEQHGGSAQIRDDLLAEVANLVEWPVPFVGAFDKEFLEVPPEALISSMESHQKCFSLVDDDGQLLPKFIGVANIESTDPAQMIAGFERVIRPRLADAQFFWTNDLGKPLTAHRPALDNMVFQDKLGTLGDRVQRIERLARSIAGALGLEKDSIQRAAQLAKCDLLSEMVFEFPELQGIAGHRIALAQGEPAAVAVAIEEHYQPKGAGDALPQSPLGQVLALADRLDILAGIFAAGLRPTGSKDPFALRRAALGTVRLLVECELDLDMEQLLDEALSGVADRVPDAASNQQELLDFVMDRTRAYYADQGISHDVFDAVWALKPTRLVDFHQRLLACQQFRSLADAPALASANKRIGNILRKAATAPAEQVDPNLFDDAAETALAEDLADARGDVMPMLEARDYQSALSRLAQLRPSTDRFFDQVMVMAEHPAVRANRLALLSRVKAQFDQIADLSKLDLETAA